MTGSGPTVPRSDTRDRRHTRARQDTAPRQRSNAGWSSRNLPPMRRRRRTSARTPGWPFREAPPCGGQVPGTSGRSPPQQHGQNESEPVRFDKTDSRVRRTREKATLRANTKEDPSHVEHQAGERRDTDVQSIRSKYQLTNSRCHTAAFAATRNAIRGGFLPNWTRQSGVDSSAGLHGPASRRRSPDRRFAGLQPCRRRPLRAGAVRPLSSSSCSSGQRDGRIRRRVDDRLLACIPTHQLQVEDERRIDDGHEQ
jgi:hypothetical protein